MTGKQQPLLMAAKAIACVTNLLPMLRIALLLSLLFASLGAEVLAVPAAAAAPNPIHRRKPLAGNYRPVYKYYRGAGRPHRLGGARRHPSGRSGSLFSRSGRARRGTL